ncbi:hypothetical protein [Vitreimonas flagellata]|uniref:hypothetical protein n=1 Tax=Vitreimonas flagellata TaxID=2560861 RepID=UPI0010753C5D|nr:hypothetical protein [Vitreimonas flagellata]
MRRLLKMLAAFALLASPASADQVISLDGEVVRIIRVAMNAAPYRSWDELRVAMPQTVRWHLAPPDDRGTRVIRRSGWISVAGRQAGVAACGSSRGPELLALRMADGMAPMPADADAVVRGLREGGVVLDRTPDEDRELYTIDGSSLSLQRIVSCTREGAAVMRSCEVTFLLSVRPDYRSAPIARTCRAP